MINLHRTVDVLTFDIEATVALGGERPELLAVARLAQSFGPIRGRDVSEQLLARLPEHVGERVIERCLGLGLLTRGSYRESAALSALGEFAIESGSVLVPEEGAWRLYYVEDPLVQVPLVHVERLDTPYAGDERRELSKGKKMGSKARIQDTAGDRLPDTIRACVERQVIARSVAKGPVFQVQELPGSVKGAKGPRGTLELEFSCRPGAVPRLRTSGHLSRPERAVRKGERRQGSETLRVDEALTLPERVKSTPYDGLWVVLASMGDRAAFGRINGWYKKTKRRLYPAPFVDLDENARTSFRRTLVIPPPNLGPEIGAFKKTVLENVDLVPQTAGDAQEWAEWLQLYRLTDYVVPDSLEVQRTAIRGEFPYHEPQLVSTEQLRRRALADPLNPKSRFLLAPDDLGLWS